MHFCQIHKNKNALEKKNRLKIHSKKAKYIYPQVSNTFIHSKTD